MGVVEHFTTAEVAPQDALDFWNRIASETYSGLTVDGANAGFSANMRRWRLDCLTMIRAVSEPAVIRRGVHGRMSDLDRVVLHVQHRGSSRNLQGNRICDLAPGDLTIGLTDKVYGTDISARNDMLVVEMPRQLVDGRIPDLESRSMQLISGNQPGARLLHDFLLSLWQQGDQSAAGVQWQQEVVSIFVDLLALAVNHRALPAVQDEPQLRSRLLAAIDARLTDPELGTVMLAAEQKVSVRTVQTLFAQMGTTPSAFILERRLSLAADRLIAEPGESITGIAYDVGFNESAYFSRCFRRMFGVSPSDYRHGGRRLQ